MVGPRPPVQRRGNVHRTPSELGREERWVGVRISATAAEHVPDVKSDGHLDPFYSVHDQEAELAIELVDCNHVGEGGARNELVEDDASAISDLFAAPQWIPVAT
jgi:hypothetical protein